MNASEWFSWKLDTDTGAGFCGDWLALKAFLLDDGDFPSGSIVTITNLSGVDDG